MSARPGTTKAKGQTFVNTTPASFLQYNNICYNASMTTVISNEEARRIVSANLTRRLADRQWTQADLARAMFKSDNAAARMRVSRWCGGDVLPTPADLANLAAVLECTMDDLLSKARKRRA